MSLPHAPYADALHAALAEAGIEPALTLVTATDTLVKPTGHTVRDLSIALTWESGLTLTWRHVHGWSLGRPGRAPSNLDLPLLVDPAALVPHIRAALDGRSGCDIPDRPSLWANHHAVDKQIADWEDQP